MTILFQAAEARELAGLLRRGGAVRRLHWPVDYAREADFGAFRALLLANGPGPDLAAESVTVAANRAKVDVLTSTGYCGALDPALRAGAILVASRVDAEGGGAGFVADPLRTPRPFASGTIISLNRVARTPDEKRRLRAATGASAVEMEAAGVALRAREWGVRFVCVRVVLDEADEGFELDWNAVRSSDGRFSRARILMAAMRRPAGRLPELLKMKQRSRKAADALGEFLADCSF